MMQVQGLIIALVLAAIAGGAIVATARTGPGMWQPVAAILALGLAGYAWQGSPGQPGSPVSASAHGKALFDERIVERRQALSERFGPAVQWLTMSDGLARQGQTQDSANVLARAVESNPKNPDLWVGLGNALVLHEEGVLSPAAEYAFKEAIRLKPNALSPQYFYGLALAQSGRLAQARTMWSALATELPATSQLRAELERNVALIDRMQAEQAGVPPGAR